MDAVVRTAEAVSTRVATVGPTTFPKPSRKLVAIGQAIDVERFAVSREPHDGPLRALVVGRYSPAKGVGTILRAVRLALDRGLDLRLDVYGPVPNEEARRERAALGALVAQLELAGRAELHDAVTRAELVRLLAGADVLVNNAPGGADRIVYEAAAAGVPVLASNPANANVLDPDAFYARDDAERLAGLLEAVAALDAPAREALARRLRSRVENGNSVDSWAAGLLRAAGLTVSDTSLTRV
jgi:glycosyltransferase involved in cell wall biosynthesis